MKMKFLSYVVLVGLMALNFVHIDMSGHNEHMNMTQDSSCLAQCLAESNAHQQELFLQDSSIKIKYTPVSQFLASVQVEPRTLDFAKPPATFSNAKRLHQIVTTIVIRT
ncbi:hypothetical protein KBD59_04595 [Candidatus Gracilibacteria bacterium]|nr:hypothetical protein [Candidatus Gracilibacteria bacterium]